MRSPARTIARTVWRASSSTARSIADRHLDPRRMLPHHKVLVITPLDARVVSHEALEGN